MKTEPLWQRVRRPRFPRIAAEAHYDVVVIGGGITGITTAYLLKQAGKKVCLLERDRLGFVDTGLTTAHLTYVTDLRIHDLLSTFGEKAAALVLTAGAVAIDTIESIVRDEGIECGFKRVPGFLMSPIGTDKKDRGLRKDVEAAKRLGLPVRDLNTVPYFRSTGIQFPNQAKFHPLKYIYSLGRIIHGGGSAVFEHSEVSEVQDKPLRVMVNKREIKTKYVVIATHVPLMGKSGLVSATLFQTKIYPYSSYVIGARVPKHVLPEALFWDTDDPYHYLRVEAGRTNDYAIFGGNDHKTGQLPNTEKCIAELNATLWRMIPQAKPDRQWSGQVIETNDGLPYIGETSDRQFVATGFSGNGMTFGTVAALMARDTILHRKNPWKDLFAVDRNKVRGGTWSYLKENVDFPYYYLKDRVLPAEGNSLRQVKSGEGKVLKLDGQRVACSRDESGTVQTLSPYCTHLGCLVHWNRAEQTWDCPCHGSRFQPDGAVLAGPAESALEPIKIDIARNSKAPRGRQKSKSS